MARNEGERLAIVETTLRRVAGTVDELHREIHGPGNGGRRGLRQRVHDLVSDVAALRVELERRDRLAERQWSRRQKALGLLIAGVALVLPLVNLGLELAR